MDKNVKKDPSKDISNRTVARLTEYLGILKDLSKIQDNINSIDLANIMKTTSAQVRKDLSTFGDFGVRGKGYDIKKLIISIEKILGIDTINDIILIGYGNMGHMISSNAYMLGKGFKLVAVFDKDEKKVGKYVMDTKHIVKATKELKKYIKENSIDTAILSVTTESAQKVADELISYGIKAILNLTAYKLIVDKKISVVNVDISAKLQELNFWRNYINNR